MHIKMYIHSPFLVIEQENKMKQTNNMKTHRQHRILKVISIEREAKKKKKKWKKKIKCDLMPWGNDAVCIDFDRLKPYTSYKSWYGNIRTIWAATTAPAINIFNEF